jgi:hypothetical protein
MKLRLSGVESRPNLRSICILIRLYSSCPIAIFTPRTSLLASARSFSLRVVKEQSSFRLGGLIAQNILSYFIRHGKQKLHVIT